MDCGTVSSNEKGRRRDGRNVEQGPVLRSVGIFSVLQREDVLEKTLLLPPQERLFAGDMEKFGLHSHPAICQYTELAFHGVEVPPEHCGLRRRRLRVRLGRRCGGSRGGPLGRHGFRRG